MHARRQVRYWERPVEEEADKEAFYQQSETVCRVYQNAPALHKQGTRVVSTDLPVRAVSRTQTGEKTGIQAKQRARSTLPMKPGRVEYQEFEYKRHGTCCLIANFEVATGQILSPTLGKTRREEDFKNHIEQTLDLDPEASWIFIVDQLNTHQSESLVRLVANLCEIKQDLGVKGKSGILKSMKTRAQFLPACALHADRQDQTHLPVLKADRSHPLCLYPKTRFLAQSD